MVARKNYANKKNMNKKPSSSSNVRFCEVEQVYLVELIDTKSNSTRKAELWYSKTDLANSLQNDDEESCCNTNTNKNTSTSLQQRRRRERLVSGLLQENKHMGLDDPRGLFQYSRTCSKQSRQDALLQLGRAHEHAVRSFQEQKQTTLDAIDDVLALLSQ